MIKFLVPVDGSEYADRAVHHVIQLASSRDATEIHLLNVRPPVDAWEVTRFLTADEIAHSQTGEGEADMASARRILDDAGVPYSTHIEVGAVAPTIAATAQSLGCDAIVMGTHGRGELGNLVLGSIATKVIHLVKIPVTLVR